MFRVQKRDSNSSRNGSKNVKIAGKGNPTSRPFLIQLYGLLVCIVITLALIGVLIFLRKTLPRGDDFDEYETAVQRIAAVETGAPKFTVDPQIEKDPEGAIDCQTTLVDCQVDYKSDNPPTETTGCLTTAYSIPSCVSPVPSACTSTSWDCRGEAYDKGTESDKVEWFVTCNSEEFTNFADPLCAPTPTPKATEGSCSTIFKHPLGDGDVVTTYSIPGCDESASGACTTTSFHCAASPYFPDPNIDPEHYGDSEHWNIGCTSDVVACTTTPIPESRPPVTDPCSTATSAYVTWYQSPTGVVTDWIYPTFSIEGCEQPGSGACDSTYYDCTISPRITYYGPEKGHPNRDGYNWDSTCISTVVANTKKEPECVTTDPPGPCETSAGFCWNPKLGYGCTTHSWSIEGCTPPISGACESTSYDCLAMPSIIDGGVVETWSENCYSNVVTKTEEPGCSITTDAGLCDPSCVTSTTATPTADPCIISDVACSTTYKPYEPGSRHRRQAPEYSEEGYPVVDCSTTTYNIPNCPPTDIAVTDTCLSPVIECTQVTIITLETVLDLCTTLGYSSISDCPGTSNGAPSSTETNTCISSSIICPQLGSKHRRRQGELFPTGIYQTRITDCIQRFFTIDECITTTNATFTTSDIFTNSSTAHPTSLTTSDLFTNVTSGSVGRPTGLATSDLVTNSSTAHPTSLTTSDLFTNVTSGSVGRPTGLATSDLVTNSSTAHPTSLATSDLFTNVTSGSVGRPTSLATSDLFTNVTNGSVGRPTGLATSDLVTNSSTLIDLRTSSLLTDSSDTIDLRSSDIVTSRLFTNSSDLTTSDLATSDSPTTDSDTITSDSITDIVTVTDIVFSNTTTDSDITSETISISTSSVESIDTDTITSDPVTDDTLTVPTDIVISNTSTVVDSVSSDSTIATDITASESSSSTIISSVITDSDTTSSSDPTTTDSIASDTTDSDTVTSNSATDTTASESSSASSNTISPSDVLIITDSDTITSGSTTDSITSDTTDSDAITSNSVPSSEASDSTATDSDPITTDSTTDISAATDTATSDSTIISVSSSETSDSTGTDSNPITSDSTTDISSVTDIPTSDSTTNSDPITSNSVTSSETSDSTATDSDPITSDSTTDISAVTDTATSDTTTNPVSSVETTDISAVTDTATSDSTTNSASSIETSDSTATDSDPTTSDSTTDISAVTDIPTSDSITTNSDTVTSDLTTDAATSDTSGFISDPITGSDPPTSDSTTDIASSTSGSPSSVVASDPATSNSATSSDVTVGTNSPSTNSPSVNNSVDTGSPDATISPTSATSDASILILAAPTLSQSGTASQVSTNDVNTQEPTNRSTNSQTDSNANTSSANESTDNPADNPTNSPTDSTEPTASETDPEPQFNSATSIPSGTDSNSRAGGGGGGGGGSEEDEDVNQSPEALVATPWPQFPSHNSLVVNHVPFLLGRGTLMVLTSVFNNLNTYEPIRQMMSPSGASGATIAGQGIGLGTIGGIIANIGVSFVPGITQVDTTYCLDESEQTSSPTDQQRCPSHVSVNTTIIDICIVALVMNALVLLTAASKWFKKPSTITADPTTIAGVASVMGHPEVTKQFSSYPADTSASQLAILLRGQRFKLGEWTPVGTEDQASRYGIVPVSKSSKTADDPSSILQRMRGIFSSTTNNNNDHDEKKKAAAAAAINKATTKKSTNWLTTQLYIDGGMLLVVFAILSVTIAALFHISNPQAVFPPALSGSSWGGRVLFALIGAVVAAYWTRRFADAQALAPYRVLGRDSNRHNADGGGGWGGGANAKESVVLDRRSIPLFAIIPLMRAGHWAGGCIAFTALMAEVLVVALAGLPYRIGQLRTEFFVCAAISSALLSLMALQILFTMYWRKGLPKLPRRPDSVAAVMTYVADTEMARDFEGLEDADVKDRNRAIVAMGKRYAYGWRRRDDSGNVDAAYRGSERVVRPSVSSDESGGSSGGESIAAYEKDGARYRWVVDVVDDGERGGLMQRDSSDDGYGRTMSLGANDSGQHVETPTVATGTAYSYPAYTQVANPAQSSYGP